MEEKQYADIYYVPNFEEGLLVGMEAFDKKERERWLGRIIEISAEVNYLVNIEYGYDKATKTYFIKYNYYGYTAFEGDDCTAISAALLARKIREIEEAKIEDTSCAGHSRSVVPSIELYKSKQG